MTKIPEIPGFGQGGSNQKEFGKQFQRAVADFFVEKVVESVLVGREGTPVIPSGHPTQLTKEQIALAKARYLLDGIFEDSEKEEGLK